MDILLELQEIFREVFEDDSIILSYETTSEDIEDWDSLAQMQLIMEIEKKYKIRFSVKDIENAKNVGEFVKLVERYLSERG